jgi:hypothetical protein
MLMQQLLHHVVGHDPDLLPVGYFHVVFTVPSEIANIAFHNKATIYNLLFQVASETMLTIAADPRHLGARIGITAVLHTWGSALTQHPHIHMVVPGGGISLDGRSWVASRPAFLLPVHVLSKLFRRLFLTRLIELHAAGQIQFFGDHARMNERRPFLRHLAPLRKKNWIGRSSGEAHFDTRMSIISGTTRCLLDSSSSSFRSVCGSVNSVLSFLLLNPVSTVYAAIRHIFLPSLTLATALCRLRGHPPRCRLHSRTWVVAALKMLPSLQ